MIKNDLANNLAKIIYKIDTRCREELTGAKIVSERDYVSIFLSNLAHPFGILNSNSICFSQTLPSNLEQKFGCDGIIVFHHDNKFKVCLFEAKVLKNRPDSYVFKPNKMSRFQRQLNKQKNINEDIAIWEMLINKNENNRYLDEKGSTCVLFEDIKDIVTKNKYWKKEDLLKIALYSYNFQNTILNYQNLLTKILTCKYGKMLDNQHSIHLFKDKNNIQIPIIDPKDLEAQYNIQNKIIPFLQKSGIYSYTNVDLNSFNKILITNDLIDKKS